MEIWQPKSNKVTYQKYKKIVYDHYGWKCMCCGESNPIFLTIDHVNNDASSDKTKNGKRHAGIYLYQKIIQNNFSDLYQVLCYNCNCGKHRNKGICPHQC